MYNVQIQNTLMNKDCYVRILASVLSNKSDYKNLRKLYITDIWHLEKKLLDKLQITLMSSLE